MGRSMLIPIAALPFAGILLRLGADDLLNIPIITAAGNAMFGNLDILFAIGLALGFSDTKDKGMPALTAIVGMLAFREALAIVDPEVNMGIFAGIVTGFTASFAYNRFKDQKLPQAFSLFGGERFPVNVVMIFSIINALILGNIWPFFQNGLNALAETWVSMGALGVGMFLFLNRLLIPLGLHHVINSYVYFDLGEYVNANGEVFRGEITRFINGDPTAGLFLAGFFVVLMFGVPGIAYAIYKASYPENKARVKGLMGSGAFTSFLTNISEPVEFTFMFSAPTLFLIHSLYAGLAGIVTYMLDIRLGFTFGASLVDYVLNFQLGHNVILIIPVGIVFFFLYYFTFYYYITKKNVVLVGREEKVEYTEEITEEEKEVSLETKNYDDLARKLLQFTGGKENIDDAYNCVTRLRITVHNPDLIDEEKIKQTGVAGVIWTTDKDIQIVIGPEVTYVMSAFNDRL